MQGRYPESGGKLMTANWRSTKMQLKWNMTWNKINWTSGLIECNQLARTSCDSFKFSLFLDLKSILTFHNFVSMQQKGHVVCVFFSTTNHGYQQLSYSRGRICRAYWSTWTSDVWTLKAMGGKHGKNTPLKFNSEFTPENGWVGSWKMNFQFWGGLFSEANC